MNRVSLLLLLVCVGLSRGAPVEEAGPQAASCTDPVVLGAANEAMDKINKDRSEGYVFSLKNLVNAHTQQHGENSVLFYLTMNVQETNCSVVSRSHFKNCEVRDFTQAPEYGQCKAAIFISRVNRVSRLYKYNCVVRPVAAARIHLMCPDCPSHMDKNSEIIQKTVSKSVEKFNKDSGLTKFFRLLQITRATSGYGMGMMYYAQFSIQETTCANGPQEHPEDCPLMDCEFAHKGFCKASHIMGRPAPSGEVEDPVRVSCEIYEPQAAEEEKKLHLLGAAADHSHDDDTQASDHSHDHQHTHAGHSHAHSHGHGHAHGHHHDAHDHSRDRPHQHHQYQHAAGVSTHHHDHELALDHAHNHSHLHEHEHHHHHHHHHHQTPPHKPQGAWRRIPALVDLEGAVTLPAFPDVPVAGGPEAGVTLPLTEDPQIPGQKEPSVDPFPAKLSPECPVPPVPVDESDLVAVVFAEDPQFKLPA